MRIPYLSIAVVVLALTAACGNDRSSDRPAAAATTIEPAPLRALRTSPQVLRLHVDTARGLAWTLQPAGVRVHDASTGEVLRSIRLPGWMHVGEAYACPPDLALGPDGHAVVTSNATPALWRIDAATFDVTRHDLEVADDGKDLGFTGLVYAARHRAWFAVTGIDGRVFSIDAGLTRAEAVALPVSMPRACGVSIVARVEHALCVHTEQGPWIVGPSLAGRPAFARPDRCRADLGTSLVATRSAGQDAP